MPLARVFRVPSRMTLDLLQLQPNLMLHFLNFVLKAIISLRIRETSQSPIYLNALISSEQENVNINLLTTITSGRIKKLMGEGKTFAEAKAIAEDEALKIFDLQNANIENAGFEEMNISKEGNANAILLAASCLIQQDRSAGEVQKLISDISSEFETSGKVSEKLYNEITSHYNVYIENVVRNLLDFYKDKEVDDFEIPAFYGILDNEYASGFHNLSPVEIFDGSIPYNTTEDGKTDSILAIAYDEFVAESDVDWISYDVKKLCERIYEITYTVAPSNEDNLRRGNFSILKKDGGEQLFTVNIKQKGLINKQRIYFTYPEVSTKAFDFMGSDEVNINGTRYSLILDTEINQYYVEVPEAPDGYAITDINEITPNLKDVLSPTVLYYRNADDYEKALEDTRYNTPYHYAALKPSEYQNIPNPTFAQMQLVSALVELKFEDKYTNEPLNFSSMEIEMDEDVMLSGKVTECLYPDYKYYDPTYLEPEPIFEDFSNKVLIRNRASDSDIAFQMRPNQRITKIKVTGYDSDYYGNVLFTEEYPINLEVRKGMKYTLTISSGFDVSVISGFDDSPVVDIT